MQHQNHANERSRRVFATVGLLLIGLSAYIMFGLKPEQTGGTADGTPLTTQEEIEQDLATVTSDQQPASRIGTVVLRDSLGIEISSLYLSVGGTRVDMRYKVVNTDKASQLTNEIYRATLIAANGQTLSLPNTPQGAPIKVESGTAFTSGRIYSYFFPNPNHTVKSGDTVTLRIGNLRAESLVVQ